MIYELRVTNCELDRLRFGFVGRFFALHEAEFFQLVAECVAADVEELGGLRLVVVGLTHGEFDEGALDFFQRSAAFGDDQRRKAASAVEWLVRRIRPGAGDVLEGGAGRPGRLPTANGM